MPSTFDSGRGGEVRVRRDGDTVTVDMPVYVADELASKLLYGNGIDEGWRELSSMLLEATEPEGG